MLKVQEVSRLTGVSVRALHHYDQIGLLPPTQVTEAGYRLYDEESLVRLQLIMLYRTLEFPLKDIKRILDSPDFDRNKALDQQLTLLKLRREHLDNLIALTQGIRLWGVKHVSFEAFDTTKIEQYTAEARASWGQTDAWREYEQKRARRDAAEEARIGKGMMTLMASFGALRGRSPSDPEVQARVQALRDYITQNYYDCTPEILRALSHGYAGGGSMNENIDKAGGPGTGECAAAAIQAYCDALAAGSDH